MNIFTIKRAFGILAFGILFFCCFDIHAQPANGKWTAISKLPILTNAHLVFADSLVGYYIGQDTGYVTKDGALTWTQITFPDFATPSPSFLFALSHNTVMSFQQRRIDGTPLPGVMISNDMGTTWSVISSSPIPNNVYALTMWNANDGIRICVDDKNTKDTCAVTHDGGKTYTDIRGDAILEKYISHLYGFGSYSIKSAWSDSLHGVISVSATALASYPVLTTINGGRSWTETHPTFNGDPTKAHSFVYLYPGSQTIWTIPSVPQFAEYFFYSTNYGSSWTNTSHFKRGDLGTFGMPAIVDLAPISPNSAWAIVVSDSDHPDLSRNIIAYNNQFMQWVRDTALTTNNGNFGFYWYISGIHFTDSDHGWVTAEKKINQQGNVVTVDTEFFYRFRTTPQNGVQKTTETITLRCIPNPASSTIRIEGFAKGENLRDVKIFNTLGNEFSRKVESSNLGIELDVSHIPNGCYIVSINTSLRKESIPVMVVH